MAENNSTPQKPEIMASELLPTEGAPNGDVPSPFAKIPPKGGIIADDSFFDELNTVPQVAAEIVQAVPLSTPWSPQEEAELTKYITGQSSEPPALVRKGTEMFTERAAWALIYFTIRRFQSVKRLMDFTDAAEARMFDVANLNNFTAYGDEIQKLWEKASNRAEKRMDMNAKFLTQNSEMIALLRGSDPNPKITEVTKLLSDLTPEALDDLIDNLKEKG